MALPIQRPPFGLVGLLNTKVLGRNPAALEENVRATVALDDFYLYGQPPTIQECQIARTGVVAAGTWTLLNGAGTTFDSVVPEGTFRKMRFASFGFVQTGGGNPRYQLAVVSRLLGIAYSPMLMNDYVTSWNLASVGGYQTLDVMQLQRLTMLPGDALAILTSVDSVGSLNIAASWFDLPF